MLSCMIITASRATRISGKLIYYSVKPCLLHTISAQRSAIHKKFSSIDEINAYIDCAPENSWDPSIYSKPPSDQAIKSPTTSSTSAITIEDLQSLCSLSGLQFPNDAEEQKELLKSLNNQRHFLNHLHCTQHKGTSSTQSMSNLINSEKISFESLVNSVENIEDYVDSKKGENGTDFNITSLAKLHENDFYVSKP